jgi:mycofactocin system glycosyltransferase
VQLRQRLLDAGMVHPTPVEQTGILAAFVIPVHGDADGLTELLHVLRSEFSHEHIIVVDDASPDPSPIASAVADFDAHLLRIDVNVGPAQARNAGWQIALGEANPDLVVFLDADVCPKPGAIKLLLDHFGDHQVGAVAPRVMPRPGTDMIAHYEADNSPLDMGTEAAIVAAASRVSYVPTAALAIRADVLREHRGFADMRFGEDVDLVWRLLDADQTVRYEPRAVVHHRNRSSLPAMARQRFGYGTAAAPLATKHRDKIAPLQMSLDLVATTLAAVFGGPLFKAGALAMSAVQTKRLADKLAPLTEDASTEAARLRLLGHGYAVRGLGSAATRAWAPLMLLSGRTRRVLAAALVLPALWQWFQRRPATNPLTHAALRVVDRMSYCAGVWVGAWREGSLAALLPDVRLHESTEEASDDRS